MNVRFTIIMSAAVCGLTVLTGTARANDAEALAYFEREVRPVLADRCYECHGTERQRSDLRVDHLEFMLAGGAAGPAVVPGDAEQSRLITAIRYDDVDFQMPPRSKLPDEEIAVLERWVEMGAPWPDEEPREAVLENEFDLDQRRNEHWAWQPVESPAVPSVENAEAVGNAIDAFIVAKLEEAELEPAEQADRRTLIRRLSFDLTGLPPTPEEVEAFLADESEDAYEQVVDRLLASPRFGERWARHWMDLVRYGETHGHEFDYPIHHAWQYRDYLIRAFNADLPYDQFVTEQIAGDLLDKPRMNEAGGFNESIIGTGFYWLGEAVHAPVDVRADQADRLDNQIDVLSKSFVGLTVSCARCHDHMFDAISTDDFYALYGVLASSRRDETYLDQHGRIGEARGMIEALRQEADAALTQSMPAADQAAEHVGRYLTAAVAVLREQGSAAAVAEERELDGAMLERWVKALGENGVNEAAHPLYPLRHAANQESFADAWADLRGGLQTGLDRQAQAMSQGEVYADFSAGYEDWRATGQAFDAEPTEPGRLDVLSGGVQRPNVAHSGATAKKMRGVLRSPTFTIDTDFINYRMAGEGGRIRLIIDNYFMDVFNALLFEGIYFDVNTGGPLVWHSQDVRRFRGHRAHIELIDDGEGWAALDQVVFSDGRAPEVTNPLAGHLKDAEDVAGVVALAQVYGRLMGEALEQVGEADGDAELQELLNWALRRDLLPRGEGREELEAIAGRIAEVQEGVPAPMRVLASVDGNGIDEHVFIRGSHQTLGDVVPRRFLEGISGTDQEPMPADGSGRLELAKRITDPENPFYSRVIVNRLWHHVFGRGIVSTVNDFGVMGTEPTHPELLDYLATRFMEEGQSLKGMIRLMVTSRTYQMRSDPGGPADEADPTNDLFHRMPIRRLQGEAIRDATLAVSGRLNEQMHGPSVEVHLSEFMSGRGRPGASGPLDGDGRRSVYTKVRRNFLSPMMLAFDMPVPFSSVGDRSVSNVPAQALILLNDPFVVEQARLWAERVLAEGADDSMAERIEKMYVMAYARPPSAHEISYAEAFFTQQAEALGVEKDDVAVWSDFAHVLMNVKEFIFIN